MGSMSELDVRSLTANFDLWKQERATGLSQSKAFERYVFEQILKDHDPADEDLDVGDFGSGDDGGIDGMFLYMGGQIIGEETDPPVAASDIELHLIQAKFENGFKETAVEKMESFARDLLAFDKPVPSLTYLNSKARDAISSFRSKYSSVAAKPYTLTILFHYACIAEDIPNDRDKVTARAANLTAFVRSKFSFASVEFIPWAAPTLWDSVRNPPISTVAIPFSKQFSTADQCAVCLVKLTDYARHILTNKDGHLQRITKGNQILSTKVSEKPLRTQVQLESFGGSITESQSYRPVAALPGKY
jgi:hypothetical protein